MFKAYGSSGGMILNRLAYTLCLDVGFAHMGYAVYSHRDQRFIDAGCIATFKAENRGSVAEDNIKRCRQLFNRLATITAEHKITRIVAEYPHGGARNSRAMVAMSMASAIVTCFATHAKLDLFPTTPNETKRLINPTKQSKVEKSEVIAYVEARYGSDLLPDNTLREHTADAMAAFAVWSERESV